MRGLLKTTPTSQIYQNVETGTLHMEEFIPMSDGLNIASGTMILSLLTVILLPSGNS